MTDLISFIDDSNDFLKRESARKGRENARNFDFVVFGVLLNFGILWLFF
jgi:hypothetical protein